MYVTNLNQMSHVFSISEIEATILFGLTNNQLIEKENIHRTAMRLARREFHELPDSGNTIAVISKTIPVHIRTYELCDRFLKVSYFGGYKGKRRCPEMDKPENLTSIKDMLETRECQSFHIYDLKTLEIEEFKMPYKLGSLSGFRKFTNDNSYQLINDQNGDVLLNIQNLVTKGSKPTDNDYAAVRTIFHHETGNKTIRYNSMGDGLVEEKFDDTVIVYGGGDMPVPIQRTDKNGLTSWKWQNGLMTHCIHRHYFKRRTRLSFIYHVPADNLGTAVSITVEKETTVDGFDWEVYNSSTKLIKL